MNIFENLNSYKENIVTESIGTDYKIIPTETTNYVIEYPTMVANYVANLNQISSNSFPVPIDYLDWKIDISGNKVMIEGYYKDPKFQSNNIKCFIKLEMPVDEFNNYFEIVIDTEMVEDEDELEELFKELDDAGFQYEKSE